MNVLVFPPDPLLSLHDHCQHHHPQSADCHAQRLLLKNTGTAGCDVEGRSRSDGCGANGQTAVLQLFPKEHLAEERVSLAIDIDTVGLSSYNS